MKNLVRVLEEMTREGKLTHDESCRCDRCVEQEATNFLEMLQKVNSSPYYKHSTLPH